MALSNAVPFRNPCARPGSRADRDVTSRYIEHANKYKAHGNHVSDYKCLLNG